MCIRDSDFTLQELVTVQSLGLNNPANRTFRTRFERRWLGCPSRRDVRRERSARGCTTAKQRGECDEGSRDRARRESLHQLEVWDQWPNGSESIVATATISHISGRGVGQRTPKSPRCDLPGIFPDQARREREHRASNRSIGPMPVQPNTLPHPKRRCRCNNPRQGPQRRPASPRSATRSA